ncbi:zinc finger BED domain-containing protein 4-like [Oncorhynchus keta]|uniref:zinc finger BED domain-containing protein 4-like n=1 Tax=Oncorhynchus keta TaxID=8018 RepID=UPI00227BB391|nr:zinc finger BED domain-containing protein 4-like [Oncorhynchus keta]
MKILKSMVASDEDKPAARDVKTTIRVNLEPRYADPGVQDFLHKSTTLDPRFKSLLHLDAAARLRVYNELTAEIVTNTQQGQATGANPSPEMADYRGSTPEKEVTSYREVDCIPLDADPLTWWKTKELIYLHVAMLGRRYLAEPGTSVPSERIFSTATWLSLGPLSLARWYSPQLPGCAWDLCP